MLFTKSGNPVQTNPLSLSWVSSLAVKPIVFFIACLPFIWLVYAIFASQLGENPIEKISTHTGEWALRFLLFGLTLTPFRWMIKKSWPLRFRRMIGLFTFFYAGLHLCTYLVLDQQFDWLAILNDVLDRPYITAGSVAFLILLPLAITSNRAMLKRLGRRWQPLHRWVYLAATAAVLHFVWLAKGDRIEPLIYLAVLMLLLTARLRRLVSAASPQGG